MLKFNIVCYIAAILFLQTIWCRVYEECRGITEPDVVVASKKSCAKYIYCNGEKSHEAECLAGNHFNEKAGICEDPELVKCDIEPNDEVKSIFDEDFVYVGSDLETTEGDYVIDEAGGDSDKENLIDTELEEDDNNVMEEVEEPQTNIAIVTPQQQQSQSVKKCPKVKGFQNMINIANPESCLSFFTCYNGHAIPMLCTGKMYFNEATGKCQSEIPSTCQSKTPIRLNCHKDINDYVPHPQRCEYYYYCLNGFQLIMRCPQDFTWHYQLSSCVHKSKSKCYSENSIIYRNKN